MASDLALLRDIHHPPAISIWPLAMGWYLLIGIVVTILIAACYVLFKRWTKHRVKRLVLARIEELKIQQNKQHINISHELSALLKRAALASHPRRQVAGLYGQPWLDFLDKTGITTEFSQGAGRLLIICPYQGKNEDLPEQLFHLIKCWVKKNL